MATLLTQQSLPLPNYQNALHQSNSLIPLIFSFNELALIHQQLLLEEEEEEGKLQ